MGQARNNFLNRGGRSDVHLDVAPEVPLVMANRRRIVQVPGNLLSNAANNSPFTLAFVLGQSPTTPPGTELVFAGAQGRQWGLGCVDI